MRICLSRWFRPGVEIRTFVPGQDEQEWLRVNAAAFAHHPEQALIDGDDLADRMAEPWFDAEGFFVATIDDTMVGFHWTKQHQDQLGVKSTYSASSRRQLAGTRQGAAVDRAALVAAARKYPRRAVRRGRPPGRDRSYICPMDSPQSAVM